MPFKSIKQRTWMKENKPEIFKKWKLESGLRITPKKKPITIPKKKKY